ncbi:E3 ubiquitin-protein ligase NEDD4-like [Dendronephthya gigantea]|uniref:E3 ubiquitin-protein ligase NEDD4-like n=1 Tax=Dendronephthya gigantea TaxID=151771 RepID=UPI00106A443F|nr:E3 ubiquitin-protein ligase NEDD4-like [Dendronephthya gigantea]
MAANEDGMSGDSSVFGGPQQPVRVLRVAVLQASDLAKKDIFGLSDPYCRIVQKNFDDTVIYHVRTDTIKKTLNPEWNEVFDLSVDQTTHKLSFEVFDENRLTRDDFLGRVDMPLTNIPTMQENMDIIPKDYNLNRRSLRSRVKGSLKLLLYFIRDGNAPSAPPEDVQDEVFHENNEIAARPSPFGIRRSQSSMRRVTVTMPDVEEPSAPTQLPVLPAGWGERQDANGRTYYINHRTRTTSWTRPTVAGDTEQNNISSTILIPSAPNFERPHIERNQYSLRRHLSVENDVEDNRHAREVAEIDPLPPGWAVQYTNTGRAFFLDHNTQRTTWTDPRHTLDSPLGRSPEAPAPTISETQDLGPLPDGWEERVNQDGKKFYIDHNTRSTQWEDPRFTNNQEPTKAVPYSRSYKKKYDLFRSQLKRPKNVPNKYDINVRREHVLEDSFRAVTNAPNPDHLKTRPWVIFDGEVGLDYGGVQREWFYLLSKEVFNPYYGLFEYSANDTYTLQINPNSGICNEEHLKYFKFIGRVAGMAVYHGKLLDAFFIRPFYKMMLGKKIDLIDMESVDSEYYNSLQWILDNDAEVLDLTFSVDEEVLGQVQVVELTPGGANIKLTNTNKSDYIRLIIEWRFVNRVEKQMKKFMEGFNELVPQNQLKMFDERELELLMCGVAVVDIDDWRKNTMYRGEYHDQHSIIQWFWKAVQSFNMEDRACLLQFVTGTSRVPMNGFAELYGSNGPQKFTIEPWGKAHSLPRAHTCFNRLDLPKFSSYHELKEKLKLAIYNTEGFDGVD